MLSQDDLKMVDVDSASSSAVTCKSTLNETEGIVNQLNLNVPSYMYREIPTVCETLGAILNIAIVVYFIKSKKYRTPIFTILSCLATMDTCVCLGGAMAIFTIPSVIAPEAGFMCPFAFFVTLTGILGSEYTLIFFAGVRLYQVVTPLKAMASITMSLMLKCCAAIITVSATLCLLHAAFWRSVTIVINGEDTIVCFFLGDNYSRDTTLMILVTVIPCVSIFFIHVLKYFAYLNSRRLLATKQVRKSPDGHVAAIIIILFYICWIPAMAYITIQHLMIDGYAFMQDNLYIVLAHVAYANSIMNPLVYVLAVKSIRDDVINLLCFRKLSNSRK